MHVTKRRHGFIYLTDLRNFSSVLRKFHELRSSNIENVRLYIGKALDEEIKLVKSDEAAQKGRLSKFRSVHFLVLKNNKSFLIGPSKEMLLTFTNFEFFPLYF